MQIHIPLITDFWENILQDKLVYKKNAMEIHYEINKIYKLERQHFDAWLNLFNSTLDELYEGEKVILAKKSGRYCFDDAVKNEHNKFIAWKI